MLAGLLRISTSVLFVLCVTNCGAEPVSHTPLAYPGKLWITVAELQAISPSSVEKAELRRRSKAISVPALFRRNEQADTALLAGTYLALMEDQSIEQARLRSICKRLVGSEVGAADGFGDGESLALARNLPAVLIACKLLGLDTDAGFTQWVRGLEDRKLGNQQRSLRTTHERRPNNWGTHAGAARAARAAFLGDSEAMAQVAQVFAAWVGEEDRGARFRFGEDLSWQPEGDQLFGVNPVTAVREGHSLNGVLPDDQRRGGSFRWPPPKEPYVWEALQGAVVTAQILHDNGYTAWQWGDQALLRAVNWLVGECSFRPVGDDLWVLALIDYNYGTQFTTREEQLRAKPGKNMGFIAMSHPVAPRQGKQP